MLDRPIDKLAVRCAVPVPVAEVRSDASRAEVRDQLTAHVISLARYLADRGVGPGEYADLRADEMREVNRKLDNVSALRAAHAARPQNLSLADARARLDSSKD